MLSACDPDRPVADGPVGQSFILGPVGPRRMFSLNELNQPVAVGPVDQPFTTGPVGTLERESDCKQMDRIADSPVGSTEILDQVKQTGSHIQTDFMKLDPITEPASLGDNPPSSDSGVHSLGEQWENMSTSSIEMEPEQNDGPTNGSPKERNVSDNRVRPNTEEDEDINYPWTDYLLNEESDEKSSIDIQQNGRSIQYNDVTICENDNSSVNSGTDGGNSDIDVLTDFSDDDEYFIDRANRLYVECYNDDWCEGMTNMTYTLPLRESQRRRCEVWRKNETEIEESIGVTSDWGFQTDEESPKSEPTVQPGTVDDGDVPPVEDRIDDRGRRTRIGSDGDISSDTDSNLFDRPVTESATAWAGRYSHGPDGEYWENFAYPMTIGLKRLARDHRNTTGDDYSFVVKELARGMMRDWVEERARPVEQHAGCRIPDCQCDGHIEIMEWDPEDMT